MKIIKLEELQRELKNIPEEMGLVPFSYVKEAIKKCTIEKDIIEENDKFKKIRKVLDKYDERDSFICNYNFFNELIIALYDEVNIYYISRALKMLCDEDIPDDAKNVYLKFLRREYQNK